VVFKFQLLKANPSLDLNASEESSSPVVRRGETPWCSRSPSRHAGAVAIFVGTDGSTTVILPQHIWAAIKEPCDLHDTSPVGTGPFTLTSFSNEFGRLHQEPSYWEAGRSVHQLGGVQLDRFEHDAELGLENGSIDMSYDAISDPQRDLPQQEQANAIFWPISNMNYLYMNTMAKGPFSDVKLPQGGRLHHEHPFLAQRAYFGRFPGATGGLEAALVPAQVKQWFPSLAFGVRNGAQ